MKNEKSLNMNIITLKGKTPKIPKECFIANNVSLIGDITIGEGTSIWFNSVLRGDVMPINIGKQCNIQDSSVLHGTYDKCGVTLEDRVTIGHSVVLHGCFIGQCSLIGMSSVVMDEAHIGKHCLLGAGSLVVEGTKFPDGYLIFGRPAKIVRPLTKEEIALLEQSADNYLHYSTWYQGV